MPAWALIGSELRVTSLQEEIQEFFIGVGGGPNFGSERTVELFWGKLPPPHPLPLVTEKAETTTYFWICESQLPLAREIHRLLRVPKDNHIFEYPWNLVWWQNATRVSLNIHPVNQWYTILSYQVKWGGGGGGSGPRTIPPWIRHCFGALWYPFYSIR